MIKVLLDASIYNRLSDDSATLDLLKRACLSNLIAVLASRVVRMQLQERHFGGIPDFFPVKLAPDQVFIPGLAIPGLAIPGSGTI